MDRTFRHARDDQPGYNPRDEARADKPCSRALQLVGELFNRVDGTRSLP